MSRLVLLSFSVVCNSLRPHKLQHTWLPSPSLSTSLFRLVSFESNMPPSHLILCRPLLLLPSIFPSIIKVAIVIFSSIAQSWLTFCDPMTWSTPGFPVYHRLTELAQTHAWVGDAIQLYCNIVDVFSLSFFLRVGGFIPNILSALGSENQTH